VLTKNKVTHKKGVNLVKKAPALFLVICLAAALTACGGSAASSSQAEESSASGDSHSQTGAYRSSLKVALDGDPPSLDAHMTNSLTSVSITRYMYEGLVEFDSSFKPQPQLPESVEHNEDNTEWTFKLRQGVKFQNGKEMTSADAADSLNIVVSMSTW